MYSAIHGHALRHGPPELYSYTALYTIQLYSAIHYTTSTTPLCTPPYYRAPPPTPAALPIANTRPQRASLAATTAAIQNSVQKLAATTRLGVKKKIYPN